jgi:HAD superfamily hydrolase (TIGR01509 family)
MPRMSASDGATRGQRAGPPPLKGQIQTFLFDFGGTLDANGMAWKERFYALYRCEGLEMAPDGFESSFFAADDSLIGNLAPQTDLSATVHALVGRLEAELARRRPANQNGGGNGGSNSDRGMRVAARFLADASAAVAGNRPVLQALRERYRLGIVSNFYGNLQAVCDGAGLASIFSAVVDSHCIGAEKPDPAIFQAAFELLGAAPATTVLVGDSLRRDCEGARRTGMRFIWMAPHGNLDPAEAGCSAERGVEHTITGLPQLMQMLI